ncbi:PD-(D/E)XK nuclease family protein [Sphingomonas faeni]|uniref:PD-(D/E)XK nuclease family protein n=1 Tax=Sphingomonas faeni TaxID=185950 RepID=UPI00335AAF97
MSMGLSGSTIKSWFQYRCERKTRYEMMNPAELAAIPVSNDHREKRWAVLGVQYENRVVANLARSHGVLLKAPHEEALSEHMAAAFFEGRGSAQYAAQVNLRPTQRPDFLIGQPDISLRRTFADLIRRDYVDGIPVFTVIDIKATRVARAFHKTQVAFYALLLDAVLKELKVPGRVARNGEIWRIPDDGDAEGEEYEDEAFSLKPYERVVDEFARNILPQIAAKEVSAQRDQTFFHVYFKCEQCSYLTHCMRDVDAERGPDRRDVSAVAGLSHESKRTLNRHNIFTVADLATQGEGLRKADGAGWALSRRADQLIARAKALATGEPGPGTESQTFLMPARTDASIYIVADYDPVDDGLATIGYLYNEGGTEHHLVEVLASPSRTAEADAMVRVFTALLTDLQAVHDRNEGLDAGDAAAIHSHIFIYESTEANALQNAISRHLDDPRIRGGLLNMVRLFPPDDLVPEPEFKGMHHLPATAIRNVVEQLHALPVTVSHDLRQVTQVLRTAGRIATAYEPSEEFSRPFSALLSLEISRNLREGRPGHVDAEQVRSDVLARLQATKAIAEWLRAEHATRLASGGKPMLRLNKRPFRFQATFDPIDAGDLDVLKALELLENRSGMLQTLIRLAQPGRTRRDGGYAIGPMRLDEVSTKGRYTFLKFLVSAEAKDVEIRSSGMGMVVSDGSPDLLLEPGLWSGLSCDLLEPRAFDQPNVIRLGMRNGVFNGRTFQDARRSAEQTGWWLDQTFVDFNSAKADAYLSFLAAGDAA